GLIGCSHSDKTPGIPAPPPPPKAAAPAPAVDPDARVVEKEPKEEPKALNAKPSTCVSLGDFKAQIALDISNPMRGAAEREVLAQQAKQSYQRALQLDPKYVPAFLGLASLCEGLGERDQALSYYRTVLKLEPNNLRAYFGMAHTYESAEMREQALTVYNAAAAAMPGKPEVWCERGMCLGRAKLFDDALVSLQRAAALRPTFADYNKAVGLMLARL